MFAGHRVCIAALLTELIEALLVPLPTAITPTGSPGFPKGHWPEWAHGWELEQLRVLAQIAEYQALDDSCPQFLCVFQVVCFGIIQYCVAAWVCALQSTLLVGDPNTNNINTTDLLEQTSSISTLFRAATDLQIGHCDAAAGAFLKQI